MKLSPVWLCYLSPLCQARCHHPNPDYHSFSVQPHQKVPRTSLPWSIHFSLPCVCRLFEKMQLWLPHFFVIPSMAHNQPSKPAPLQEPYYACPPTHLMFLHLVKLHYISWGTSGLFSLKAPVFETHEESRVSNLARKHWLSKLSWKAVSTFWIFKIFSLEFQST